MSQDEISVMDGGKCIMQLIMASIETCLALAPYCKYALLSEDFESGLGWSCTEWMKKLEEEPGISTPLLGKYIIDSIINENEIEIYGDSSCFALFNESVISSLFLAWKDYAYKNEASMLNTNYSKNHQSKRIGGRSLLDAWIHDGSNVTISDYYITDMLALVENVDTKSDEAKTLTSALKACIAYYGHTSDRNELTGMAVSLPYGDPNFYSSMAAVFKSLKIDQEYIEWLRSFTRSYNTLDYYNYDDFEESWGGWGEYEDTYGCPDGICTNSLFYDEDADGDDSTTINTSDYYGYLDSSTCDDWICAFGLIVQIRSGFCEDSDQERIRIRSKPLIFNPCERITKTVVSCRSDMGSCQEECEADDMHGECYHL